MRINDQKIHGKHVISADGVVIGTVEAILFDSQQLRVDCITVQVRKEITEQLGVARSMFHKAIVEIPAPDIQSVGDTVVLSVPLASLRAPMTPQKPSAVTEPRTAPVHR
jgi:sporulation protein YlmC with PRC-barrel domain